MNNDFDLTIGIINGMIRHIQSDLATHRLRQAARTTRVKANNLASRAKQTQADADFAEYLEAGFTVDELATEFPGAHMRHLNAIWRAKQPF